MINVDGAEGVGEGTTAADAAAGGVTEDAGVGESDPACRDVTEPTTETMTAKPAIAANI